MLGHRWKLVYQWGTWQQASLRRFSTRRLRVVVGVREKLSELQEKRVPIGFWGRVDGRYHPVPAKAMIENGGNSLNLRSCLNGKMIRALSFLGLFLLFEELAEKNAVSKSQVPNALPDSACKTNQTRVSSNLIIEISQNR